MGERLVIGCGYLGRRIALRWRGQGHRVVVTTRSQERAREFRGLGLEPIVCDVLDPLSLRSLPGAEVAVHCVGFDRGAGVPMRSVYVDGLGHVLDALAGRAARFVHVSSTGVYGQDDGSEVDETAATEPADESGRVVLEAEGVVRAKRPDAVVLRFAGIYGPGRLLARAQALRAGEPMTGDPSRWLNLIHVEDGAEAVAVAAERAPAGETYNVADDVPVTRGEFYSRLAQLLGGPEPTFEPVPPGGPAPGRQRTNRRVVNRKLREGLGVRLRYPSCAEGLPPALAGASPG